MLSAVDTSLPSKNKTLRIEQKKSQEEMARELGVSRSCLANYETGNRQPDYGMLIRLADLFHVMVDYLIDREPFRNFDLTDEEIAECIHLKSTIKGRDDMLDLSVLNIEGKIAVIEYYDYMKNSKKM